MGAAAPTRSVVPLPSDVQLARWRFKELERWLMLSDTLAMPLHQVEVEQEKRGREIMRLLLQAHLDARGPGDVGPALQVLSENSKGDRTVRRQGQKRSHLKQTLTVFGAVMATRTAYYAPGAQSVHPLDEEAWLPKRIFGYEVQRRLHLGVLQGPFDEALERVEESTGLRISKHSAEDLVCEAATDFDAFYAARTPPPAVETGPVAVAAIDCKGVPMVKPEEALRVVRLGSGEKANKKRMATVAAVFTQQPRPRTPEEVIESLFYEGPRALRPTPKPRVGPEHKRVWASLRKGKKDVIAEVAREVAARDPLARKKLALVVDGERGLQHPLAKALPRGIEILDLLHATEKLWNAAYCFHEPGTDEAKAWVRERTLRILQGGVSQVIKGMRQSATKRGLSAEEREAVDATAQYFRRNRHRMRYDKYLAQGLPIASGAVEGACKNLVKARMNRSGMRWTIETAETVLRLRATYLSGDFNEYWQHHVQAEQQRHYPPGRWEVVAK